MNMIKLEKQENIAILRIDRPEAMNSLNAQVLSELADGLDEIENDCGIKAVIITGEGKAFVAGADIAFMHGLDEQSGYDFGRLGQQVFRRIETMEKPVIAAVNGFALGGGCELAMACDIRIASERAKFGQPEVGLGIIPGYSGTQRLPRLVGKGKDGIDLTGTSSRRKRLIIGLAVIRWFRRFDGRSGYGGKLPVSVL